MSLFGLIKEAGEYEPTLAKPPSQHYQDQIDSATGYAQRPESHFVNDMTEGVKEKANLMGPKAQPGSDEEAMNSRSNQFYDSQINSLLKQAEVRAVKQKMVLQSRALDENAALYSNMQSRAQFNWRQIVAQRESAIAQEAIKRQLLLHLFGGLGQLGGAYAAKGLYNSNHPSPTEQTRFEVPKIPRSYESRYFGRLGEEEGGVQSWMQV